MAVAAAGGKARAAPGKPYVITARVSPEIRNQGGFYCWPGASNENGVLG
ncbi:MAG: hypothetical protein ACXVZR_06225 [Terriglobales bacterium]